MTEPKWLIAIATLFVAMSLICGVVEQTSYLSNDVPGLFQTLITPPSVAELVGLSFWDRIVSLWDMLWFNYSFFHGGWKIFQYFFQCISLALIVSYGAAILQSLISAGASIISRVGGLIAR